MEGNILIHALTKKQKVLRTQNGVLFSHKQE